MNILWIYNKPLEPEAGGTERITSLIAKGLSKNGHNCLGILVFNDGNSEVSYNGQNVSNIYSFLVEKKVDVVINQIAYSKCLLDSFLLQGGNRWKQEGGRIISCLHFDPQNPSMFYFYKEKLDKNFRDWLNVFKTFLLYNYYLWRQENTEGRIYNYIYDNSDWFVVLSETHFPYLHRVMKRYEYDKLVAINNPLTFDDISNIDSLKGKKKNVLVCARMSEYHKRISLILKAWKYIQKEKEYSEWSLILLGDGPDLEKYKHYVRKTGLSNVFFKGQLSPESFYRDASILALTSSAEGWGLTITESLQRGVVPVVMNSCPVFSEIILSGYNGFLTTNGNITEFAEKVKQLMHSPRLLRQMQENALISAEKFYLSRTIVKWENLLRK